MCVIGWTCKTQFVASKYEISREASYRNWQDAQWQRIPESQITFQAASLTLELPIYEQPFEYHLWVPNIVMLHPDNANLSSISTAFATKPETRCSVTHKDEGRQVLHNPKSQGVAAARPFGNWMLSLKLHLHCNYIMLWKPICIHPSSLSVTMRTSTFFHACFLVTFL